MKDNPMIAEVVKQLKEHCEELQTVYLISYKNSINGDLTSFKLAIIVDDNIKSQSERVARLYMDIDSEMPFDLVLYTNKEFNSLKDEIGTFAWKIYNSGTVLYG